MSTDQLTMQTFLKSKKLPSLPTVAVELLELASKEDSSLPEFARAVKQDPAMVVRLLRAANSPLIGTFREILTIDHAISLLGQSRTVSHALGFCLTDDVHAWPMKEQYERFWLRSACNGASANILANKAELDTSSVDYFLVGLLLDIGQLALLTGAKERYGQVYELALVDQVDLHAVEIQVFGFDHAEIGGELLRQWKLPERLCELVSQHNQEEFDTVEAAICRLAGLYGEYFTSERQEELEGQIVELATCALGIDRPQIARLFVEIEKATCDTAFAMNINCEGLPPATELMSEAMEALIDLK